MRRGRITLEHLTAAFTEIGTLSGTMLATLRPGDDPSEIQLLPPRGEAFGGVHPFYDGLCWPVSFPPGLGREHLIEGLASIIGIAQSLQRVLRESKPLPPGRLRLPRWPGRTTP